jgi:hypothetical protein
VRARASAHVVAFLFEISGDQSADELVVFDEKKTA